MKPIRIFRHVVCEGPGYLGSFLDRHAIPFEMVCIGEGVEVSQSLESVSGLVSMGGSMNVSDSLQWMVDEQRLIRSAIEQQLPVMGVCLGAQLMSAALGGTISHAPDMEIGWHRVVPLHGMEHEPWIAALPELFTPFHWHADTFTTPAGATPLLRSVCDTPQAFAIGNSIAMQFHLEMNAEMVKKWVSLYGSDLKEEYRCAQSAETILDNLSAKIEALHHAADHIYSCWLEGVVSREC